MKRVIINGDDYGYTEEKSEGILKAYKEGVLTSTTVMVNMVSKTDVNKLLKYKKSLGIGLHLNITRGKPISLPKEVSSLINEKGEMFRPQEWTRKAWNDFVNLKNIAEIELEFNNQLKAFKEKLKISPSHIDNHHLITSHKKIFSAFIRIAKENNLPIRLPLVEVEEKTTLGHHRTGLETSLAKEAKKQCKTADYLVFDRFCAKKNPVEELKNTLKNIKEGATEFIFHPSLFKLGDEKSVYGKIDLDLLINPEIKKVIKEEGIQLISYKEL